MIQCYDGDGIDHEAKLNAERWIEEANQTVEATRAHEQWLAMVNENARRAKLRKKMFFVTTISAFVTALASTLIAAFIASTPVVIVSLVMASLLGVTILASLGSDTDTGPR